MLASILDYISDGIAYGIITVEDLPSVMSCFLSGMLNGALGKNGKKVVDCSPIEHVENAAFFCMLFSDATVFGRNGVTNWKRIYLRFLMILEDLYNEELNDMDGCPVLCGRILGHLDYDWYDESTGLLATKSEMLEFFGKDEEFFDRIFDETGELEFSLNVSDDE